MIDNIGVISSNYLFKLTHYSFDFTLNKHKHTSCNSRAFVQRLGSSIPHVQQRYMTTRGLLNLLFYPQLHLCLLFLVFVYTHGLIFCKKNMLKRIWHVKRCNIIYPIFVFNKKKILNNYYFYWINIFLRTCFCYWINIFLLNTNIGYIILQLFTCYKRTSLYPI